MFTLACVVVLLTFVLFTLTLFTGKKRKLSVDKERENEERIVKRETEITSDVKERKCSILCERELPQQK